MTLQDLAFDDETRGRDALYFVTGPATYPEDLCRRVGAWNRRLAALCDEVAAMPHIELTAELRLGRHVIVGAFDSASRRAHLAPDQH